MNMDYTTGLFLGLLGILLILNAGLSLFLGWLSHRNQPVVYATYKDGAQKIGLCGGLLIVSGALINIGVLIIECL